MLLLELCSCKKVIEYCHEILCYGTTPAYRQAGNTQHTIEKHTLISIHACGRTLMLHFFRKRCRVQPGMTPKSPSFFRIALFLQIYLVQNIENCIIRLVNKKINQG